MIYKITCRVTGALRFEGEFGSLKLCLEAAVKADAYLAGADLARANLAGANLARANLADADLARANLADADLADADLAGAYLADADLARANLADADLAGVYLAGAYLAGAYNVPSGVEQTDPPEPYERKPSAERYAERAARFRERNPDVPVIPDIDARILAAVEVNPKALEMGAWHTCETTHCRGGWAINFGGEQGKALEDRVGTERAARMIYMASTGRVPHFYASNERALEDIREQAALQTASS